MRLLLIRHGETADNTAQVIGSRLPGPPLSATGVEQARALSGTLAAEQVTVVHSSRALRALQTAETLAASLGVPHVPVQGLHEIEAGDLEGRPYSEARSSYVGTMQRWWTDEEARIPGGENGTEFMARFGDAVASSTATTPPEATVVVVAHEAAICVWAAFVADNVDAAFSRTHGVSNTGIVVLEGSVEAGWTATSWDGENLLPA